MISLIRYEFWETKINFVNFRWLLRFFLGGGNEVEKGDFSSLILMISLRIKNTDRHSMCLNYKMAAF